MPIEREIEKVQAILRVEGCLPGLKTIGPGESVIAEGGKLLRPRVVILSALACGYGGDAHIGCAAAVELLHNSTLLHDDIMDNGMVRRGRPTVNARLGESFALMAGDHLLARSFSLAAEHGGAEAARVLADCYRDLVFGQMKEMENDKNPDCPLEDYYAVNENKTASLFRACADIGAICAGAAPAPRKLLADVSFEMGKLFQVADDVSDYRAPEEKTGKKRFQDVREGKMTLPLILLLKKCSREDRVFVVPRIGGGAVTDADGARLESLFDKYGIIKEISGMYSKAHGDVRGMMENLPAGEYREEFTGFINGIIERAYPVLAEK